MESNDEYKKVLKNKYFYMKKLKKSEVLKEGYYNGLKHALGIIQKMITESDENCEVLWTNEDGEDALDALVNRVVIDGSLGVIANLNWKPIAAKIYDTLNDAIESSLDGDSDVLCICDDELTLKNKYGEYVFSTVDKEALYEEGLRINNCWELQEALVDMRIDQDLFYDCLMPLGQYFDTININ